MRKLVFIPLIFLFSACAPVSMKWVNEDPKANLEIDEAVCKRDLTRTPADDSQSLWVDQALREKAFTKCMQAKGWHWLSDGTK